MNLTEKYDPGRWNERYAAEEFFYGTDPNDFLRSKVAYLHPGAEVLCLAEGEGRNAVFLAELGMKVTAVDGSEKGIEKLRKLASQHGVKVEAIVSDLEIFDLGENRWDAIVSVWCHLPSGLRAAVHERCVKALKSGGFMILEAYTPDQLNYKTGGPPTVDLLMSKQGLAQEFRGLDAIVLREIVRSIHEGSGHNGPSAVVQFLGRKS